MKILLCFGTRPEAIKMAPIYFELKKHLFNVKICVTAQHREMLDQVLDFFEIVPDYDLNLMRKNQSLNTLFASIMVAFDEVLTSEVFDLVLVHGDTTTSTAVGLASFHKGIKVGHVEAGLRTYNKKAPFPEELNRQLTGRIVDYHFAPTKKAAENLINEGICKMNLVITGNSVIDALQFTLSKTANGYTSAAIERLQKTLNFNKKTILVTGHRRESFGEGFVNICNSLLEISKRTDVEIVYPVHLNPNVKETVFELLSNKENIYLIAPLEYPSFVWLMSKAALIISDSGGVQEEAPSLNIPVLVTRATTERAEGIKAGYSYLVGTNKETIVNKAIELLNNPPNFKNKKNPYGNGNTAKNIASYLMKTEVYVK